tara:strand:- start:313 stop:492 length:180 start_codon:yes stop_codon:yes gene_type:complete
MATNSHPRNQSDNGGMAGRSPVANAWRGVGYLNGGVERMREKHSPPSTACRYETKKQPI